MPMVGGLLCGFARSTYPPKTAPVWRFLTTGESPLHWTFELVDFTAQTPTFRWDDPVALDSDLCVAR